MYLRLISSFCVPSSLGSHWRAHLKPENGSGFKNWSQLCVLTLPAPNWKSSQTEQSTGFKKTPVRNLKTKRLRGLKKSRKVVWKALSTVLLTAYYLRNQSQHEGSGESNGNCLRWMLGWPFCIVIRKCIGIVVLYVRLMINLTINRSTADAPLIVN